MHYICCKLSNLDYYLSVQSLNWCFTVSALAAQNCYIEMYMLSLLSWTYVMPQLWTINLKIKNIHHTILS